jgi:hypothetical protein
VTARDTSPVAVAERVAEWRMLADAYADIGHEGIAGCLRQACDLIEALAADLARVEAERDEAVARAEADRLESLEEYVREHGMNVDDDVVDSCAKGSVYRAMLDLSEAGRMTIEPGGVGRRIYGRWVAMPPAADEAPE